jgi:hypothetical protein
VKSTGVAKEQLIHFRGFNLLGGLAKQWRYTHAVENHTQQSTEREPFKSGEGSAVMGRFQTVGIALSSQIKTWQDHGTTRETHLDLRKYSGQAALVV